MSRTFKAIFTAALYLLIPVVLITSACGDLNWDKPQSFGRQKEILVICDDDIWDTVEKPLRRAVERTVRAVRTERIFELSQVSAANVQHYKEWDKIILIESMENPHLLSFVVADSTMEKIRAGEGLFFNQIDVWADNQRVVGLAAPRNEDLPRLIAAHGERIFEAFITQVENQELYRMYHSGRDTLFADSLAVTEGFSIVLPNVYARIRQDSLGPNELLFVHQEPVRSIYVSWDSIPGPLERSQEALAAHRNKMLEYVYPHQQTIVERVDTSTVVVNGIERLRVFGVWENREEVSGGIYITHIIDSPEQNRRYYLDALLFSPDMRKNKYRYIFQLDQLLRSFQIHLDNKAPEQGKARRY